MTTTEKARYPCWSCGISHSEVLLSAASPAGEGRCPRHDREQAQKGGGRAWHLAPPPCVPYQRPGVDHRASPSTWPAVPVVAGDHFHSSIGTTIVNACRDRPRLQVAWAAWAAPHREQLAWMAATQGQAPQEPPVTQGQTPRLPLAQQAMAQQAMLVSVLTSPRSEMPRMLDTLLCHAVIADRAAFMQVAPPLRRRSREWCLEPR